MLWKLLEQHRQFMLPEFRAFLGPSQGEFQSGNQSDNISAHLSAVTFANI
jgi:hypothetical protein